MHKCLPGEIFGKISVDHNTDCWNFTGGRNGGGYGIISFSKRSQKGAHIVSYSLFKGSVTQDLFVCHSCDNPSCVNPDHLFLGDCQSNKNDEISKNRHAKGSRQGFSKLKEDDIPQIRRLINKGYSLGYIGNLYGVTNQAIHHIKSGKNWGHI